MPRITRRTFVAAPAEIVWKLAQDFAQWHPRLNIYPHGPEASPELVVTIINSSDDTTTLSYSMPEPPFPITDHVATICVERQLDTTSYVTWSADFEADPGILQLLEDQLGDDIFKLALDKLASACHEEYATQMIAEAS